MLGNIIMKYYFPEVVNLLKECVESYMTIVISCVMMAQKPKNLISILWLKDIEMSVAEVGLGTVIMLEV